MGKTKLSLSLPIDVMNWIEQTARAQSAYTGEKPNKSSAVEHLIRSTIKRKTYLKYLRSMAKDHARRLKYLQDSIMLLEIEIEEQEKKDAEPEILIKNEK